MNAPASQTANRVPGLGHGEGGRAARMRRARGGGRGMQQDSLQSERPIAGVWPHSQRLRPPSRGMGFSIPHIWAHIPRLRPYIPRLRGHIPWLWTYIRRLWAYIPRLWTHIPRLWAYVPWLWACIRRLWTCSFRMQPHSREMGSPIRRLWPCIPEMRASIWRLWLAGLRKKGRFSRKEGRFSRDTALSCWPAPPSPARVIHHRCWCAPGLRHLRFRPVKC